MLPQNIKIFPNPSVDFYQTALSLNNIRSESSKEKKKVDAKTIMKENSHGGNPFESHQYILNDSKISRIVMIQNAFM